MAYMNQERKKQLEPEIKAILKKYNLKGTLSVRSNLTLCLTIRSGNINFCQNFWENIKDKMVYNQPYQGNREKCDITYISVNDYHMDLQFSRKALKCLQELRTAMMRGNHNNSDIMTDYFDVGWYIDISIGTYNKPYIFTK